MEEFAKYYSNVGTMLLICESLEDLKWGEKYGYGYVSKSGATVRDFLFQPLRIAYPQQKIPGGMDNIPVVHMGDTPSHSGGLGNLRGLTGHCFVNGYLRPEAPKGKFNSGGDSYFSGSRMNGPFPKMLAPLWCEVGHKRFPNAGFDYFWHKCASLAKISIIRPCSLATSPLIPKPQNHRRYNQSLPASVALPSSSTMKAKRIGRAQTQP